MSRLFLVTGAASGIGRAVTEILEKQGDRVIGADLHDADIVVDLGSPEGRAELVRAAGLRSEGRLDGVLAVAGTASATAAAVAVNYFGAVATLEGVLPLLRASRAPRAVVVSSMASLMPVDAALEAALLAGDEARALARADELAGTPGAQLIYASTKKALCRWVRRQAATPAWAGAGIPLNAVAPGVIRTPMVADLIATPEGVAALEKLVPMPLNGFADAAVPAQLLAWLVSEENSHLCGQVIFVDGGSDVVLRGDGVF
jgi:NAD(P)-dependent dehydrogenase (short-subunit alcohol dehydrogenase family)